MTYMKILWVDLLVDVAMRAAANVFKIVFWHSDYQPDDCLSITAVNTVAEVEKIQFGLIDTISSILETIIKIIEKILTPIVLCIFWSVVHMIIMFGLIGQKILDEFTDQSLLGWGFFYAPADNDLYNANMKIDGGCLAY